MKLLSDLDKVCVAKAREAGQEHLFDRWDSLSPDEQGELIAQIERLDFQLFRRLIQQHIHAVAGPLEKRVLKPAPLTAVPSPVHDKEDYEFCKSIADYALRNGEVLVVTAAGGGGVGPFCEPVGLLPVGPITAKSVFQILAEKILALGKRHKLSLQWDIVCHPEELDAVTEHFKSRSYFGLKSSSVRLVAQGLLPVVDRRGKILLSGPGRIAMSPSGHGSLLVHFLQGERLRQLEQAGIRHIFYHQVDNPLICIAEAAFLGLHIKTRSEMSSKAVRKTAPEESVGVFCQYNDRLGVVEYTELGEEDREARLPDGGLAFSAANIGVHLLSVEFLRRLRDEGLQLPFHAVERTTPCLNRRGAIVRPTSANSIGFKAFFFDALPLAQRAIVTEVSREDEFAPVKNPSGECSPKTASHAISQLHARWLRSVRDPATEGPPPGALQSESPWNVEISPLFALDEDDLRKRTLPELPTQGDILLGGGG